MRGCYTGVPDRDLPPDVFELLRRIRIFQSVTGRTPEPPDLQNRELLGQLIHRDRTVPWRSWIQQSVGGRVR